MKKKMKKHLIYTFLILAGCSTTLRLPSENDLVYAKQIDRSMNLDSLKEGYDLYIHKCSSCHFLYQPAKYSEQKWRNILPEMADKAKISKEEENRILDYLMVMRRSENGNRVK